MNNPYTQMSEADLTLILIGLAGYSDPQLGDAFGQAETELLSRHQGHYPDWFTPTQIAVCRTLQRHIPMNRASEFIPAFFDENRPILDIIRQLHKSGRCLRWNSRNRALEITSQSLCASSPIQSLVTK